MPSPVYIALGSNLGDRGATIQSAVAALRAGPVLDDVVVSRVWETAPVGPVAQPNFLNAVVAASSDRTPAEILAFLFGIEASHGRQRRTERRFGPRTLDLDLLIVGDVIVDTDFLVLPHPRLHERAFVLDPLCDLAPTLRHPALGLTMAELRAQLPSHTSSQPVPVST
ncbi:MAG: 2-amino-4-hydroxy-6-hydroxymethyldihydropteridine diphosphokinase [Myxococcales bacterium]|nr:2-amino-4-hydroxy-6-hydroxymethyldihydropteridine diphosphokinase [Myxococcales bacterium]